MKILITYHSLTGNTKKIANAMFSALKKKHKAKIKPVIKANAKDLKDADVIGVGSGIYMMKMAKTVYELINRIPNGKKIFLFYTAGMKSDFWVSEIKKKIKGRELKLIGVFGCKGYDDFGPFKLFGGLNKGHPNKEDLGNAEKFVKNILG